MMYGIDRPYFYGAVQVLAEEGLIRKGAVAAANERCTLSAQKTASLMVYRNTKVVGLSPFRSSYGPLRPRRANVSRGVFAMLRS
jgi:hypothetical protein